MKPRLLSRLIPRMLLLLLCNLYIVSIVYSACPNFCSQHGECSSANPEYGICICDIGFTGTDCSTYLCPKSFNPMTIESYPGRRTIRIDVQPPANSAIGEVTGELKFGFLNDYVNLPANSNKLTTEECNSRLQALRSIDSVTCVRTEHDKLTGAGIYVLTIHSYPMQPYENNIYTHSGNPPLSYFSCNSTIASLSSDQPICKLVDIKTDKIPEYLPCSGTQAGHCNQNTGICACNKGFYGYACDDIVDDGDIQKFRDSTETFSGNMLLIHATRNASSKFNFINIKHRNTGVDDFSRNNANKYNSALIIRGDGMWDQRAGSAYFKGGGEVLSSGLHSGLADSVWISSLNSTIRNDDLNRKASHIGNSSMQVLGAKAHLIAMANNKLAFSINGHGDIASSGKLSSGSLASRGFEADLGITTAESAVLEKHLDVKGSMNVGDSIIMGTNFAVTSSGITVDDSLSDPHTLLNIKTRKESGNHSVVEILSATSIASKSGDHIVTSLFRSTVENNVVFDINSVGDLQLNRLSASSGIEIDSGGVLIVDGSLVVEGGSDLHLKSGTLDRGREHMVLPALHVSGKERSLVGENVAKRPLVQIDASDFGDLGKGNADRGKPKSAAVIDITMSNIYSIKNASSLISVSSLKTTDPVVDLKLNLDGYIASADFSIDRLLSVSDKSMLNGLTFKKHAITFNSSHEKSLNFPASASFITVTQIGTPAPLNAPVLPLNVTFVDKDGERVEKFEEGKILIIRNEVAKFNIVGYKSSEGSSGAAEFFPVIPPMTTICVIFDGVRFVDVKVMKTGIRYLDEIRKLISSQDIYIGNYSFSALRLASHKLMRSNIPFVSSGNKHLVDSKAFSYSKGSLVIPSLQLSKFVGDIDMSDNILINSNITDAKLHHIIASDSSLKLVGAKEGFVAVDSTGFLSSTFTNKLKDESNQYFDSLGRLIINSIEKNISLNSFSIFGASKVSGTSGEIKKAEVERLVISSIEDSGLLFVDTNGVVDSLGSSIANVVKDSALGVDYIKFKASVSGTSLFGSINCSVPLACNIAAFSSIGCKAVSALDNAHASKLLSNNLQQLQAVPSLLVSDSSGKVHTLAHMAGMDPRQSDKSKISIAKVKSSLKVNGVLMGNNSRLVDIKVDLSSFDLSSDVIKSIAVSSMYLKSEQNSEASSDLGLTVVDKGGDVSIESNNVAQVLGSRRGTQFGHLLVNNDLITNSLQYSHLSNAIPESSNQGLMAINTASLELDVMKRGSMHGVTTIGSNGLSIPSSATLQLRDVRTPALLAVDASGVLIDASKYKSIGDQGSAETTLSLGTVAVGQLESGRVNSTHFGVVSLHFSDPMLILGDGSKKSKIIKPESSRGLLETIGSWLSSASDDSSALPIDPLLAVSTETGSVHPITDLSIPTGGKVYAKTSVNTRSFDTKSLRVSNLASSSSSLASVLQSNADGSVVIRPRLQLENVNTGKLHTSGDQTSVESLTIESLKAGFSLSNLDGKESFVAIANEKGTLERASTLSLTSLAVSKEFSVDTLVAGSIAISSSSTSSADIGILSVTSDDGSVTAAGSINIQSLTSSVANAVTLESESLRIKSLLKQDSLSIGVVGTPNINLLSMSSTGTIVPVNTNDLAALFKTPLPKSVSFESIHTSKSLTVNELYVPTSSSGSLSKRSIMEVDANGNVKATDILSIENLEADDSLEVGGSLDVKSIVFDKSNFQMNHGAVAIGSNGDTYTISDFTFSNNGAITSNVPEEREFMGGMTLSKSLESHYATFGQLGGSLDANGNVISRVIFSSARINSSNIQISKKDKTISSTLNGLGDILFKDNSSGKLSRSSACKVNSADGTLSFASGLDSMAPSGSTVDINDPSRYLHIDRAKVTESIVHSSRLTDVVSFHSEIVDFHGQDGKDSDAMVYINGNVIVNGAVQGTGPFIENSDIRLKKDIQNLTNVLDKVVKLQAVTYKHRVDEFPEKRLSSETQVGWIADEVQKVLPELVVEDGDGLLAVKYDRAFAVLFEALKELKTDFDNRLDRISSRVDSANF